MVIKAPDVKRKRTYPDHGTRDSGCVGETRTRKGIAHNTKFFKKKSSLNVGHRPDQETGKGNAHDTKLFRKGNSLKGVREPGKGTWKGNAHDTKLFRKGNSLKGVRKPDKGTWKGKGHGAELLKTRSYPKGAASIPDNSVSLEGNGSKKFPHSMRGFSEKSCESHQSMCFSGKVKNATVLNGKSKNKEKMAIHIDSVQANDFASDSRKQHGKNKSGNCSNASPTKIANKTAQHKNRLDENSEGMHDHPKKKRRRIRLDPFDISNKRLEDEIATSECLKDKKEDSEKEIKLSKNAQFRAIKPSPSILSFVEDNLLGRRRMVELQRVGYNVDLPAPLDTIPFSTGTERAPIEDNVFRNNLSFFAAAKVSSSFPPPVLPEVAFAGRSNVGKSSLLNALTRQWGVVRTSDKPGHTQTINFFKVGSKLCLVDLPGYGFAYAREEAKDAWEELVKEYVSERDSQKHVCLLIDTKWGMKPRDHDLINLMERSQTKYQIVLTKTDTVFPIDVARRAMQIEESLKANSSIIQPMMMISSKTGAGIRSLRTMLAKIARYAKV